MNRPAARRVTLPSLLCLLASSVAALAAPAGAPAPPAEEPCASEAGSEMSAEVPELTAYHEVIATLWHEAWPAQRFDGLAALLPGIKSGAAGVQQATLPGILRDKREAWNEGVSTLMTIVAEYEAAVSREDLPGTLDAGERLHAQFEKLVRTIRPALPEIDAFHRVLYRLYHYDLPAWNVEAVRASVAAMGESMAALEKASLPQRLQSRQEAFSAKRQRLGEAVGALQAAAVPGAERASVESAVEAVHDRYVELEDIF